MFFTLFVFLLSLGWPKEPSGLLTQAGVHLDLSIFSTWEELASLGLDRLKSALLALGLKCGGTLEERAQRLFSLKGKTEFDASLIPKTKSGPKSSRLKNKERQKRIAALEAQVIFMVKEIYYCNNKKNLILLYSYQSKK